MTECFGIIIRSTTLKSRNFITEAKIILKLRMTRQIDAVTNGGLLNLAQENKNITILFGTDNPVRFQGFKDN